MDSAKMYEANRGRKARERQQNLGKDRFLCCGEHKADGHHEGCSKRPPDEPKPVHPAQGSLL